MREAGESSQVGGTGTGDVKRKGAEKGKLLEGMGLEVMERQRHLRVRQ